jgi:GNAT superfamily N-acetyltransferase
VSSGAARTARGFASLPQRVDRARLRSATLARVSAPRSVILAESDAEIAACAAVMAQLRPDVAGEDFVARVRRLAAGGYRLACVRDDGRVVAVAGFHVRENLPWGRHLYVDDLVTDAAQRSTGAGRALVDWLVAHARAAGCTNLQLDSGVHRFAAHRFYLRERFAITSHHFSLDLRDP